MLRALHKQPTDLSGHVFAAEYSVTLNHSLVVLWCSIEPLGRLGYANSKLGPAQVGLPVTSVEVKVLVKCLSFAGAAAESLNRC